MIESHEKKKKKIVIHNKCVQEVTNDINEYFERYSRISKDSLTIEMVIEQLLKLDVNSRNSRVGRLLVKMATYLLEECVELGLRGRATPHHKQSKCRAQHVWCVDIGLGWRSSISH